MTAKRFEQAGALYAQILNDDPTNLSAWMGMVSAHHQLGQDTRAVDDVGKMPSATYEAALADPAFLEMLGAIYQQANQLELAQRLLERARRAAASAQRRARTAVGRHLSRQQQHRAGLRPLPGNSPPPSRSRRRLERPDGLASRHQPQRRGPQATRAHPRAYSQATRCGLRFRAERSLALRRSRRHSPRHGLHESRRGSLPPA